MKNINKIIVKKHLAFTLSEILVTVGIIGVIASLTIPNLIKDYQKQQTLSKLQKVYTSLSQAVKQSEIDNGSNIDWDWGTGMTVRQSFDTYWAPYLKILKYCTTYTECGYKANIFYKKDKITSAWSIVDTVNQTTVILSSGEVLVVAKTAKLVFLDINSSSLPNAYSKDIFIFTVDPNKGFFPYGSGDCTGGAAAGSSCATKILQDNWQIKDDYPWD